jgi:hypothetical protein
MPDTSAAKKTAPAKKAAAKPTVNHAAVHRAERKVGDILNAQGAQRTAIAEGLAKVLEDRDYRWDLLTRPFAPDEIEKLPKPIQRDGDKARCEPDRNGRQAYVSADGFHCRGWHSRAVHLDYVGHAGITMRLNEVLGPEGWDFRPMSIAPTGLPWHEGKTFWGTLTLFGMGRWRVEGDERLDVSKTDLAENFATTQEAWGDCLRRCAMRFGVGTYLWSKSEKSSATAEFTPPPPTGAPTAAPAPGADQPPPPSEEQVAAAQRAYDKALETTDLATVGAIWREAENQHLLGIEVGTQPNGDHELLGNALRAYGDGLQGGGA